MGEDKAGRASILIVEDDQNLCKTLELILEKKGFDAETAGTGRQALEKAQERFFNVVLLDLNLPDKEGVNLISPLKEIHPEMEVIVTTGQATLDTAVKALNEGAAAYVTKPLDMDDVLARIGQIVEKQHLSFENRRLYLEAQREIEERKQAEEELQASKRLLQTVFDTIPHTMVIKDRESRYTNVNKAWYDFYGLSPEEVLNKTSMEILGKPEEDRINVQMEDQMILSGDEPVRIFEHTRFNHSGEKRSLQNIRAKIRDEEDNVVGLVAIALDITERKQAEEALRESEAKYRDLVETSQDLIWRGDTDGRFIYLNPAWESTLGYKPEEMLGHAFSEFKEPETLSQDLLTRKQVLSGGAVDDYETIFLSKSAQKVQLVFKAKPLIHSTGQIIGTQGTAFDITERKRAEEALRESRELERQAHARLIDAIESLPGAFAIYDAEDRFVLSNSKSMEMFPDHAPILKPGTSYEDVIRTSVEKGLIQVDPGEREAYIRKRLQEHKEKSDVIEQKWTDGRWFAIYHRPTSDGGTVTIRLDITERKQAEGALRQSEERFRKIFENSNDAIFVVDPMADKILAANPMASSMLGYSHEDLLSLPMSAIHPNEMPKMRAFAQSVLEHGQGWTDEFSCITRWGTSLTVEISASVMEIDGKNCMVALVRDTSKRKELEAQFQRAQKMEAVGTLASGIAHNFNNLLQMILMNLDLLQLKMNEDHPDYEIISSMQARVKDGAKLTNQLLAYSRDRPPRLETVDLNQIMAKTANMFSETRKDITLHEIYTDEFLHLEADQSQLEQLLLNLFVNAGQAMANGGELLLQTENVMLDDEFVRPYELESGSYVKISVRDTGKGMSKETQERIFDPFFSTKEVGQGTGLGLASVYGTVLIHKGIISVDSELDRGTTFCIYFPASEKDVKAVAQSSRESRQGTGTILLVDDEEAMVRSCGRILEARGYEVLIANEGSQAVELFQRNCGKVDLVILDMTMPGMSGGDVFVKLKELRPDVKVIVASGYSVEEVESEKLFQGMAGFIAKPFEMDELTEKIHEVLDSV